MKLIKNAEFGGERPLFESHDLRLENVIIRTGESAIKECSNIEAVDCRFEGNYPFWHVHGFKIDRCYFDVGGRSALWYSDHLKMTDTIIDAPKMLSGRSRALLPSSPISTVREGFPSYGSSFSKSLFVCRDRLILLLVSIVFTG